MDYLESDSSLSDSSEHSFSIVSTHSQKATCSNKTRKDNLIRENQTDSLDTESRKDKVHVILYIIVYI